MNAARFGGRVAQRQRDVDGLGGEAGVERRRFQDVAARGQRLRDLVLGEVDRRTLRLALVRRHLAERREQRGDRALLAERGDAHRFERGLVAGGGDLGEDGLFECCEVGHGQSLLPEAAGCGRSGAETSSKKPSFQATDRALNPIACAGPREEPVTRGMPRRTAAWRISATWMAGRPSAKKCIARLPGHDSVENFAEAADCTTAYAASAALAFSAIAWNAAGSVMARSDSTLRSTVMPDFDRPLINTL